MQFKPTQFSAVSLTILIAIASGCGLEVKPSLAPPLRDAGQVTSEDSSPSPTNSASQLTSQGDVVSAGEANPNTAPASQDGMHGSSTSIESTALDPSAPPHLVVDKTTHDFGVMDPYAVASHEFVVTNDGVGPLQLSGHQSSCKCTISQYPHDPIPPGETAKVLVRWQTLANNRRFTQSATIQTNDPATPEIVFTITGEVLVHVGANPPNVQLPSIKPDEAQQAETIVTSQVWDQFELQNLASSLEGLQWQIEPASASELKSLKARAGYRISLTLPDDLPQGPFTHWLRFQVKPTSATAGEELAEVRDYEIPITGKVLRRVAVYGGGIDHLGNVRLGTISSEEGLRHRLVLKVHDSEQELEVSRIETTPDFLQVQLTPMTGGAAGKGLFHLDLIVPPGAPPCRYQSTEAGTIRLEFNHPRIEDLTLRVHLAVAQPVASLTSTNP